MKNIKIREVGKGKSKVIYSFGENGRKWTFKAKNYNFIAACGGAEKAEKVANLISGGLKRTDGNSIDGLTRSNLDRLLNPVQTMDSEQLKKVFSGKMAEPVFIKM
jgi:hypothetical protein